MNALHHPKALELKFEFNVKKHPKINAGQSKRISNHLPHAAAGITLSCPNVGWFLTGVRK